MITTHNLPFEACPWIPSGIEFLPEIIKKAFQFDQPIIAFRIGTCEGIYTANKKAYQIIAITNDCPGNGHFEDVLEWFEASCRRDKKSLMFMDILNQDFGDHLFVKRGFKWEGDNMIKKICP